MKRFIPHVLVLGGLIGVVAVGLALNSVEIAVFVGRFVGVVADPISSMTALICGVILYRYPYMLILCVVVGVAATYVIILNVVEARNALGLPALNWGQQFGVRMVVFITLAHITHAIRLLVGLSKPSQTN